MKTLQVGDVFPTCQGGSVTVIAIVDNCNITVKHNDRYGYVHSVRLGNLNNGQVKNPYHPNVHGVGYMGLGSYLSRVDGLMTPAYSVWIGMLRRCYDTEYQQVQPTYIGCVVHSDWHNFQTFAEWYYTHPDYGKGYHLDKDILYHNNKLYSSTTCVLVPFAINNLFKVAGTRPVGEDHFAGVRPRDGKYRCEYNGRYIGTYDTPEQAHNVYLQCRLNHILSVAEQYRHIVDADIYYSIIALAYST